MLSAGATVSTPGPTTRKRPRLEGGQCRTMRRRHTRASCRLHGCTGLFPPLTGEPPLTGKRVCTGGHKSIRCAVHVGDRDVPARPKFKAHRAATPAPNLSPTKCFHEGANGAEPSSETKSSTTE